MHHLFSGEPSSSLLSGLLGNLFGDLLDGFLEVLLLGVGLSLLFHGLEEGERLCETELLDHDMGGGLGRRGGSESLDDPSVGDMPFVSNVSDMSHVPNSSDDSSGGSHQVSEVLDGRAMPGEAVSSHHGEKSADHVVRVMGGTSDDAVELVDKSVVGDDAVDLVPLHNHMTI